MSKLTIKTLIAGLREAALLKNGQLPTEADLDAAPLLSPWAIEELPGTLSRLVGFVSGHPRVPDGWCTTSVVLVIDPAQKWARTVSRIYRLENRLGAPQPSS